MTVESIRAQLDSQVAEPAITAGMTRDERRAEIDRWHADSQAQAERLDEEHLLLGIGRTAAVTMTHELIWPWQNATADRWFRALPERYMTPDSMTRPDWNHSHYPHDKHGRIGRHVTTRQRPKTQADTDTEELTRRILDELQAEREQEEDHGQEAVPDHGGR
jgi:hypothetical protein